MLSGPSKCRAVVIKQNSSLKNDGYTYLRISFFLSQRIVFLINPSATIRHLS